ncbi:IclR family transcriptional regulator [Sphingorhabdus sp. M41]|uniref:IclR family transcriptional regulator n=1 Tax=Sphingorhabdus sp. M41 TaxID=1806885 RepID=UPI00078DAC34|nr:IclR family transcriptional regulator [Sphingorhabdus sp. M41]AMO70563.1 transcriptional regulator [Sphingorhabdus sp. M41]
MKNDLANNVKASKAPAIARATAILRLLGKSKEPLSLQAIASGLGLVPSTCLYVLRALVAEELVAFDPSTKRYSLDAGILTLARQFLHRDQFHQLAQEPLDALAAEYDVTTLGVQIVGLDHIVALAVSEGEGNFRLSTRVGSRFPALISATGRCIAAFGNHSPAQLERRFAKLRWDNPPTFDVWMEQVEQTRETGFAVDEGHYMAGVVVIAAPVFSAAPVPSHALVAIGIESAIRGDGLVRLGQALKREAANISAMMG